MLLFFLFCLFWLLSIIYFTLHSRSNILHLTAEPSQNMPCTHIPCQAFFCVTHTPCLSWCTTIFFVQGGGALRELGRKVLALAYYAQSNTRTCVPYDLQLLPICWFSICICWHKANRFVPSPTLGLNATSLALLSSTTLHDRVWTMLHAHSIAAARIRLRHQS